MGNLQEWMITADYIDDEGKEVHREEPVLSADRDSAAAAWIELNAGDLRGSKDLKTISRSREDHEKKKNAKV